MSLFKRKNSLKHRVKDLENFLGVTYAEDTYGDLEHFMIRDAWGELPSIQQTLKTLQKDKKDK